MKREENDNRLALYGEEKPWYGEGLRFKCTGCGKCCTGAPGAVWIDGEEIGEMSRYLGISEELFLKNYTRLIDGRRSLIEDRKNYDCIFLKDKRCTLYEVRPKQCRTFPWWPSNLLSKEKWTEAKKWCEGIDHPDADLTPADKINEAL